ncbi:MAG TPA: [protein-PII] uridylyltransferase [Magnetospirillaceae bacterium]|jgi:[protein-PII] uridylyltransferase
MRQTIKHQREIIDRQALQERLDAIAKATPSGAARRGQVLEALKAAYQAGYAEMRRRFEAAGLGDETLLEHTFLIDQIVRLIHDFALAYEFPGAAGKRGAMAVVAVGGYGRGEMFPHSDIDLLFLMPKRHDAKLEKAVEFMLYLLWDLGLKVGHSTRSVAECIKQGRADITIRTALLEARWLWGDQALFQELMTRYRADIVPGTQEQFVEAKLAERNERHAKLGEPRYVLEPNVKDGKGGLRDLHTLYWIAKYLYGVGDVVELVALGHLSKGAAQRFAKAQQFLWTVRCHMHFITDRMDDRLTFEMQPDIAKRMRYTNHGGSSGVERFMKHYFLIAKDVGDLTRIFCALLEDQNKRHPRGFRSAGAPKELEGFLVENARLNAPEDDTFAKKPVEMIRIFHVAHEHSMDVHPQALSQMTRNMKRIDAALRRDPEANRLFLEMLTSKMDPARALRHMNEAGVLGRFVPDFGRVVAQMQYDMYHVYTVDEHTIQAMGILHRLERGELQDEAPAASEVMCTIANENSRRALYLALFLHDIAKGRNGDHSDLGAEIALKMGPRLGLTEEETETASWLVKQHLLMTRTAYKRDIDDPKTIADFISVVQSPERLKLLLVLTVADVRAVGPNVWNAWKAGLLRSLYYNAFDMMSGGIRLERFERRAAQAQDALRIAMKPVFSEDEIEAHLARGYPSYWISFDTATHLRHALLMREADKAQQPLTIDSRVHESQGVTEITVYTGDHAGLFSRIAGAMALSGASIVDAKIITMTNGMALDTFLIQDADGGAFSSSTRLAKLSINIEQALGDRIRLNRDVIARRAATHSRNDLFRVPPRVIVDNTASEAYTVIEINGGDRIGLLYDVTSTLTRLNLQIASAHISTYGERVVDVFYVKDLFGLRVDHERKIKDIRTALLDALRDPAEAEAPAAKAAMVAAQ